MLFIILGFFSGSYCCFLLTCLCIMCAMKILYCTVNLKVHKILDICIAFTFLDHKNAVLFSLFFLLFCYSCNPELLSPLCQLIKLQVSARNISGKLRH